MASIPITTIYFLFSDFIWKGCISLVDFQYLPKKPIYEWKMCWVWILSFDLICIKVTVFTGSGVWEDVSSRVIKICGKGLSRQFNLCIGFKGNWIDLFFNFIYVMLWWSIALKRIPIKRLNLSLKILTKISLLSKYLFNLAYFLIQLWNW